MEPEQDNDVLAVMRVTLTRSGMQFETIDDEIVGRGLIDALRAHFDQKMSQARFKNLVEQQHLLSMQRNLKNGGRR